MRPRARTAAFALVALVAIVAAGLVAGCVPAPAPSGRALYARHCAACHGPEGRGDGVMAAMLPVHPADLTILSATNGGTFPLSRVMSQIDGYTRGSHGPQMMPSFGGLLDGPTVLVETEDGILTPTPQPLVAVAEHVERLQR